jgi:hypothetical protein
LERPLATIDQVSLRSDRASYQVTVDNSIGFGSFTGPYTRFAEVTQGTLEWLRTIDAKTGKPVQVSVSSRLKSGWKLSPTASGGKEILEITCIPRVDDSKPQGADITASNTLTRYPFEGDRWQMYTRTGKGCWENDIPFPTRAVFP